MASRSQIHRMGILHFWLIAFFLVSIAASASAFAQTCASAEAILEVQSLKKCGNGTPEYSIPNNSSLSMNVKYCLQSSANGMPSRTFIDLPVPAGSSPTLGCEKDNNGITQSFSIHWEAGPPCTPPPDILIAQNSLEILGSAGPVPSGWLLKDHHHFKSIQTTYTYLGKTKTEVVSPIMPLVMLGESKDPPVILNAIYVVGYPNSGECLAPGENPHH